jgi:signal transduction histidine kinase
VHPASDALAFKRRFLVPGLAMAVGEIAGIIVPAISLFEPTRVEREVILRAAGPILGGAFVLWLAVTAAWMSPVQRAVLHRRRGEKLDKTLAVQAYQATWTIPLRALWGRTALWAMVAAAVGLVLVRYANWPPRAIVQLTAMVALHAFVINAVRAVWYARIFASVRAAVFAGVGSTERLFDDYQRWLLLASSAIAAGAVAAMSAFYYFFLQLSTVHYLDLQVALAAATGVGVTVLALLVRFWTGPIARYVAEHATAVEPVYRRAQDLPYRLAAAVTASWVLSAAVVALLTRYQMGMATDDALFIFGVISVMAVGAALYQMLWHRDIMAPLLGQLAVRHRLPGRGARTAPSLRTKLLLSFGGVVGFACGLALFWGFAQYKNLVTGFVRKQADLGLAWLRSEVQAAAAGRDVAPTEDLVERVLLDVDLAAPAENAIYYYLPAAYDGQVLALGGGPMGAPKLPWYVKARLRLPDDGAVKAGSLGLAGRHGRLRVRWHNDFYDLGAIAVFFPAYTGRGAALVRPLKELLVFFLVLFAVCGGIAVLSVAEFVTPIRRLEKRADGMARGELAQPVVSGGESDEIGRLTYALEEMRRALGEKLRSTEEVNLDLERAVQRRTADLAKKNRELAETLEKLTRAQSQLVRSEKMASIGQLVAGIAHEINNPVNAIVNTVGPLDEALSKLHEADEAEIRDMIRVIQRGANRTKDIVRALHNYSRTDEESVVPVDLNRALDDSLELLRHLLKQSIEVRRDYGDIGRVQGHAGQLNQVFMNLLTNAAQSLTSRANAVITVSTRESERGVVIKVTDNGPGIAAHVLPRIFDPFFTTKDVGQGTGLGLSIVHGIVERHGGVIEVDSAVGEGTTFTVILPPSEEFSGLSS